MQDLLLKASDLPKMKVEDRENLCKSLEAECVKAFSGASSALQSGCILKILNPLSPIERDECGAVVMRAFDQKTQELVVVKDYSLDGDDWVLPSMVLGQLDLYWRLRDVPSFQQCITIQLTATNARFVFPYYTLDFYQMLFQTTDGDFLLQKVHELIITVYNLHRQFHIAHRDIKAQNICFTNRTDLVLIDFDSALLCEDTSEHVMTEAFCTLTTRAPEQIRAELSIQAKVGDKTYDAFAGDWWAVGCVVAQCYLDRELFQFGDVVDLEAHLEDIEEFVAEMQHNFMRSNHPLVTLLRQKVLHKKVIVLLKGLFQLRPQHRVKAVHTFLETVSPK